MADKTAQQKEVESTAEEVEKTKAEEAVAQADDESKSENGESAENGEPDKENGKGDEGDKTEAAEESTVCSIKRKSAGGDALDGTPAEGATPEKKAKLAETAEAESNGEAEVAA